MNVKVQELSDIDLLECFLSDILLLLGLTKLDLNDFTIEH